jgi:hypothetical protein
MDTITAQNTFNPMQGQQAANISPTVPAVQPSTITHDVKLLRTRKYAQAKVEACAPEEIGWGRNTRTIKDCTYFFHSPPNHTESSLIAQGYDEEQIRELPSYNFASNSEQIARDSIGEKNFASETANRAARPIEITEHYIRMDYEGNGKSCLYKVTTGGGHNQVLKKEGKSDIEEVDVIPFAVLTPILQPHRLAGRSVADLVMDIQRINTALMRGLLDNSYMVANPRHEVAESGANQNTIDDLLTVRRNGIVRVKTQGTVTPLQTNSIVGELLPVMTYMDQVREMRSGVTRTGQGIDANALQNQSATAVKEVFSMAQAKMKLIARIFAETGIRDMFWLLHATIRKHGQKAETVRLRNQWVEVDPRNWKTRNDMTINVGLGNGGKAEQFGQMTMLANFQEKLIVGGKTNIVDDQKIYNTAAALAKLLGHKSPDQFFNDPTTTNPDGTPKFPPAQPPEDPKVTALKLKAQTDQMAAQHKAEIEKLQAQADIAVQDRKTAAEIALAQQKADLEAKLALLDHAMKQKEHELKVLELNHRMAAQHQLHQHKVTESEMGLVATAHTHDTKMEQGQQAHDAKMAAAKAKPKGDGK